MNMVRSLAVVITILGLIGIILGGVFLWQGITKTNLIKDRMVIEKVSLAVDPNHPDQRTQIRNSGDAQKAADTIASHRRAIAPSYQELLGNGQFDPTNPKYLTYAQAMNLENYLYLAVTAFGLTQVATGSGVFMVIIGLAILFTGLVLLRLNRQVDKTM